MKRQNYSRKPKYTPLKTKQSGLLFYNFHDLTSPLGDPTSINAVFIDPGTRNCGVRAVNKQDERITVYFHELVHFSKKNESFAEALSGALKFVNELSYIFDDSHYIVIERQMNFNYDLMRMSQHLISCLAAITKNKGNRPIIVEIDSRLKSSSFDKDRVGTTTKKLGIDAARRICSERNDSRTLSLINTTTKKDDICDVVCYEYIWWELMKDPTLNIPTPCRDCNVKIL